MLLPVAPPFAWLGGRIADTSRGRIELHLFSRIVGGVLRASGAALSLK